MSDDRSVALKGGIWTSVSTAISLVATFARIMILTRFLAKSDFGLVSIINMAIGLCITFTDLGFASVIMYKQKLTDREFSSLYWIQLVLFFSIYVLLWFTSSLVSSFYGEPMIKSLIRIAALSILFQAIGKLYDSVLQKQYQFKLLAFRNIVSIFISLILAVWLAWNGYGVYSLVISTLCQTFVLNLWNFASGVKIQRVYFLFDWKESVSLMKIGVYQTGTRVLDFFSDKLDVMIIGKLLGTEVLGIYDLAKELVFKFIDFIRTVVSKVALPILTNSNSDDDSVKRRFLMITKTVASLCLPICVTVAVFSKDIVHIVYGEKFLDTAPLVSIFAIITMFSSISSFFDMLGVAKGRTDLNFRNTIYRILLTTSVIFITSHWSITVVALGQLLVTLVMVFISWNVIVQKTYSMSFKSYFSQFSRLLSVMTTIGVSVYFIIYLKVLSGIDNWIIEVFIYASLYAILLMLCTRFILMADVKFFINLIKRR